MADDQPSPHRRPPARRRLGQLRGTITISDDFDDTPKEVLDSLAEPP